MDILLAGSVRKAGNQLRIIARLANAEDGYHLWSRRYDWEMKDTLSIQEEIAQSIAATLKVTLMSLFLLLMMIPLIMNNAKDDYDLVLSNISRSHANAGFGDPQGKPVPSK